MEKYTDFEEFKMKLADAIVDYLPESLKQGEIRFSEVTKSGLGTITGMTISTEDSAVAPCLYINSAFEDHKAYGSSIAAIAESMAEAFSRAVIDQPSFNEVAGIQAMMQGNFNWDTVSSIIQIKAVPATDNDAFLMNVPHRKQGDMCEVCLMDFGSSKDGSMHCIVSENIYEHLGVSMDVMFETARENTLMQNPVHVTSMVDMIYGLQNGVEPESVTNFADEIAALPEAGALGDLEVPMLVMTNENKINGAAAVFLPPVMDALAEKYPDGFYILPSSVHELIVIPKTGEGGLELEELNEMVRQVNDTELSPQDILSNHVHEYDSAAKQVYIAGDRMPSLDMEQEKAQKRDGNVR